MNPELPVDPSGPRSSPSLLPPSSSLTGPRTGTDVLHVRIGRLRVSWDTDPVLVPEGGRLPTMELP